jgi:phage/plasmid primase-like uncharacterized protein
MKENYNVNIKLQCCVCGSEDQFEFNDDKSYVKCESCGKEYFGGYEELKECNQHLIENSIKEIKENVMQDLKKDWNDMLKNAFGNNKNIKIK